MLDFLIIFHIDNHLVSMPFHLIVLIKLVRMES
jgi:hypothetical protein